jgi:hypothetical protein
MEIKKGKGKKKRRATKRRGGKEKRGGSWTGSRWEFHCRRGREEGENSF